MALATLSIDLEARLAKFEEGLGKAARISEKHAADMAAKWEKAGGMAVAAFSALGAGASVAGFVAITRASIDAIDALNDVADATGSTVENISALEDVALRTGTNLGTVETAMIKFNAALKDAKPDSDAARALKAIGLEAVALKQLDPAEALKKVADALAGFADDGNKARITQELFGKSLKEVAPFLKDLAEQGKLNVTVTKQQAEEAEKFNKAVYAMQTNIQQAGRALVNDWLPALNKTIEDMRTASSVFGGFFAGLGALNPFEGVFDNAVQGAQTYTAELTKVQARMAELQAAKAAGTDTQFGRAELNQLQQREEKVRKLIDYYQRLLKLSDGSAGGGRGVVTPASIEPPSVGDLPDKPKKDKAAALSDYDKLIAKIGEKTAAQSLEAEQEKTLTAAQQLSLDTMIGLRDGTLKLTQAQASRVGAMLEELSAAEKLNEARKADAKWLEESGKLNDAVLDTALKTVDATEQQVEAMRKAGEEAGLEGKALADLNRARLLSAAAALENKAAAMDGLPSHQAMTQAWRDQAAALRELAAETDKTDAARKRATDKTAVAGILGQTKQGQINELQKQYDALNNELDRGNVSTQQYMDALDLLDQRFTDITKPIAEAQDKISAFADQAQRNIQTALGGTFESLFRGEFDNIGDLWSDMLIKMAAQAAAQGLAETLFGTKGGSGGGIDWAGLATSLVGLFEGGKTSTASTTDYSLSSVPFRFKTQADGGAWSKGLQFYADGDVFGSPTLFQHAGGLGVLGEAGPEAVMPLRRGADGKLGVASAGGALQVSITINQTVGELVTPSQLAQVAERTRQAAMAGMMDAQRRGRSA